MWKNYIFPEFLGVRAQKSHQFDFEFPPDPPEKLEILYNLWAREKNLNIFKPNFSQPGK